MEDLRYLKPFFSPLIASKAVLTYIASFVARQLKIAIVYYILSCVAVKIATGQHQ